MKRVRVEDIDFPALYAMRSVYTPEKVEVVGFILGNGLSNSPRHLKIFDFRVLRSRTMYALPTDFFIINGVSHNFYWDSDGVSIEVEIDD